MTTKSTQETCSSTPAGPSDTIGRRAFLGGAAAAAGATLLGGVVSCASARDARTPAAGSQRLESAARRRLGSLQVAPIGLGCMNVAWGFGPPIDRQDAIRLIRRAYDLGVTYFGVGSRVSVGCMVNSCRHCGPCEAGVEQYCENGNVLTYGSKDRDGSITLGGYSTFNVVDEDFVIDVPDAIDLAHAGPMMCAGITVYSPLRHWSIGPGKKVGVVGLGGLGHMATKIAAAMGAEVTVLTTSPGKADDARRFGAKTVIVNEAGADLSRYRRTLDFILDTVPYQHDLERLIPLLKMDATLCVVGVGKSTEPHHIGPFSLLRARNSLASSQIGGIRETQEAVGFCAVHGIRPEITKIPMPRVDEAWSKVVAKEARYRFVIDMTTT